ncbi:hypothetical protein CC80DRAFT_491735 [Byssothecium circinans]|uniref:F-box domain-containing protein n=1 Tax=Byssothecium circinans TaxID=147558 RepID=A0A6A5TXT5_9PLEO|nr:hypothetical protein CC80DRAFT_491735 [Byssothecium circinans]
MMYEADFLRPLGKKPSYTGPRFRFLDLPKELRLMVYEFLPTKTRHHKLCFMKGRDPGTNSEEYQEYVILVIRSLPVQLLRTCKMINYEVVAILKPKLDSLASTVPQMILSCDFLTKDTSAHSFGGADYGHNVIRRVLDAAQRLVGEEYVSAPLTEEDIESFGPRWPEPPDAFTVDEADTAALVQFIRHAGRYLKSVVENPQIAGTYPLQQPRISSRNLLWGDAGLQNVLFDTKHRCRPLLLRILLFGPRRGFTDSKSSLLSGSG